LRVSIKSNSSPVRTRGIKLFYYFNSRYFTTVEIEAFPSNSKSLFHNILISQAWAARPSD
jgi:hypothetical protein